MLQINNVIEIRKESNIRFGLINPKNVSTGIVVRNAIGIKKVKTVLRNGGKALIGYLPATNIERRTSLAFQTFTNHILIVAIINHILYRIKKLDINRRKEINSHLRVAW